MVESGLRVSRQVDGMPLLRSNLLQAVSPAISGLLMLRPRTAYIALPAFCFKVRRQTPST